MERQQHMTVRTLLAWVWVGVLLFAGSAQALPDGVQAVTSVEGISEYRLDNGLGVLLFPDPGKETVTVNITYRVGSRHERYGGTGKAHLLEHMLFKGSKNHPNIPAELSARGARSNGTTSIDRTNYFQTMAATGDNLDWAIGMEADRMIHSFIKQEDLDSEMTVVRNEFERNEGNAFRVLSQRILSTAYLWHNHGNATIGARSDIENISIEQLRSFYRLYYQPDNAVLTVAGRFDPDQVLARVQETFGAIPKPERELPPLHTVEPPQDGERSVTVRRVADVQWFAAAYHIPSGAHPDFAPLQVLMRVLGDTPRGRLHRDVVETQKAVNAFGFAYQLHDPGLALLAAQVDPEGDLESARQALLETVETFAEQPVTDAEVERAQRSLLNGFELAFNAPETIAVRLSEYISMGDWRLLFLTRDRIEAVTAEDVQRVAKKYLVRNNRTEGRFLPAEVSQRVEIPRVTDLSGMLDGYVGREGLVAGEAFEPTFDNIDARTTIHQLNSGAQIALLPKQTRGQSVVARINLQFGNERDLWGAQVLAQATGGLLQRGTSQYSREALRDRFDELKASVNIGGYSTGAYAVVETTRENLLPTLELVAHVLQDPSFPEQEFERWREQRITGLNASRQEPQAVVSREMRRHLNEFEPDHPRSSLTLDEEIAALRALDRDALQAFHEKFYNAEQMQIAVVGDFESEPTLARLTKDFDTWRTDAPYQRIPRPYQSVEPVDRVVITPDKDNAAILAMLTMPVSENHPDAAALSMGAHLLGGGFLNSRLANRLRHRDGLSYSVGAWLTPSSIDERAEFGVFAIYAPENRAAVQRSIEEELALAVASGFSEEELSAARSGLLQQDRVARAQDKSLAAQLADNLYLGRTMQWYAAWEVALEQLTPKQVQAALKRHLEVERMSFIKAGDFDLDEE